MKNRPMRLRLLLLSMSLCLWLNTAAQAGFTISELSDSVFQRMQDKSFPKGCTVKRAALRYPIERMRLIDDYGADDERSMRANNTSCFCYRTVGSSQKLSKHAQGLAIDMNPLYNPCVKGSRVQPSTSLRYADRGRKFSYKIERGDLLWRLFTERGFRWGGSWRSLKDYQHFER